MAHYVRLIDGMDNAEAADLQGSINDFIIQEGVLSSDTTHYEVTEKGTPDMSVDVAAGIAFVANDSWSQFSSEIRFWNTILDSSVNKFISSNSSGSTRIDLVCVKIDTAADPDDDASNVASVVVVEGTPGSGAPATPSNHLKLAEVEVADGATSITNSEITDSRAFVGFEAEFIQTDTLQSKDGSNIYTGDTVYADTVSERTADNGIAVDGLTLKDGVARHGSKAIQTTSKCRVYLGSLQSITPATYTKIAYNAETSDPGANFNTSTNTFTAPVDGDYLIVVTAAPELSSDGDSCILGIGVNWSSGAPTYRTNTTRSGYSNPIFQCTEIIPLSVGDTVVGVIRTSAGGTVTSGTNNTRMAIHLLSGD